MSTVSSFLAQQEKKIVFHKLRAIKRNENPNPYRRYFCQAATKETLRWYAEQNNSDFQFFIMMKQVLSGVQAT